MQLRVKATVPTEPVLMKIDEMFQIKFIALNEYKRIQLRFATNRIKIGPLQSEIQSTKGARRHFAGP